MFRYSIPLLLWTFLHAYVFLRLASVPAVARHCALRWMIPLGIFLGSSYLVARLLQHYGYDSASRLLEAIGATWVGVFFYLFATFFALDLLSGFGFLFRSSMPSLRSAALIVSLLFVVIATVQAWRAPVVSNYEVKIAGLPAAADGAVVVVATDLHMGTMLGHSWATARAAQIAALHPTMLMLVGDVFEAELSTHESWLPVLRRFQAPAGVFVVTGNHEYYAGSAPILELFRRAGFRVLRDESAEPLPGVTVAGVDDPSFRHSQRGSQAERSSQAEAVQKTLASRPATIFLSHQPLEADRAASLGARLMFSGHTHDGQIWPFNYLVRAVFPFTAGRYQVGGMTLIVCRGTGTWGPRMRLWRRSEILRVTLRPAP